MFKIVPNPTFERQVEITRPGEDTPGLIGFTFRHLGGREFQAWNGQASAEGQTDAKWLDQVIIGWQGPVDAADQPLPYSAEALAQLFDDFPAASLEVHRAYLEARMESRAKNSVRR